MDELAQCLHDIQSSHVSLAANKVDLAKKQCLSAVKVVSELLKDEDNEHMPQIKELARFAADYYEKILNNGASTLLFSEKFLWLSSKQHGFLWYPVLTMGKLKSMEIAPVTVVEPGLKTPDLGPDFVLQFRETVSDWSLRGIHDLYQDLLPNCSFVLSLLLMAEMGMEEHLRSLVQDFGNLKVKVSLMFNGALREVSLTVALPYVQPPHERRSLFVRSFSNPDLNWPAYIEKAFLICLGQHYLFNGSNMAQDTYMLTGWFPEVRKSKEWCRSDIAELWRLKEKGQVALGLGTGPVSDILASKLGVISMHDYVVCDYDQVNETMTLKNPWAQHGSQDIPERSLVVDLSLAGHFSYMYVNWKPNYQFTTNLSFVTTCSNISHTYIGDQPQYDFCNTSQTHQNIAIVVEQYIGSFHEPRFCVFVYKNSHGKLFTENQIQLAAGGMLANSRVNYLTLNAEPETTYTIAVKTFAMSTTKFALAVYHNFSDLTLTKSKLKYPHVVREISGLWNFGYNGGNWASETYIDNPQYDIKIPESVSSMMIVLKSELPAEVSFHLLHCEEDQVGKKLRNFDKSKILFDDKYSAQLQVREVTDLEPGNYRLVVSSFDRGNKGDFKLLVFNDGSAPLQLTQVPQALGTFTQNLQFEWHYSNRHKYWVNSEQSQTRVTFHFRVNSTNSSSSTYRPAIRASLFDSVTREPIVVTKQWNDCVYGVFVNCVLPYPAQQYILLVERFETGCGVCRISVGSSSRIHLREVE